MLYNIDLEIMPPPRNPVLISNHLNTDHNTFKILKKMRKVIGFEMKGLKKLK